MKGKAMDMRTKHHPNLDPRVVRIAHKYKIYVLRNSLASEPRYEAWGGPNADHWGMHWYDPNKAILDCATAIRKGIKYPDLVLNECHDGREQPPTRYL